MRLSVLLFGREVSALSVERPHEPVELGEHDHLAAQVELAEPVPIGFRIEPNPSLDS